MFAAIDIVETIIALTTVAAAGAAAVAGPGALAQPVPSGAGPPTGVVQPGAGIVCFMHALMLVLHYCSLAFIIQTIFSNYKNTTFS